MVHTLALTTMEEAADEAWACRCLKFSECQLYIQIPSSPLKVKPRVSSRKA